MSSGVTPFSMEANGSKAGFPNKPNREKPLIAGIVILAILLVGFVIAVVVLAIKASKHSSGDVCTTDECLETALDIVHSINESADPCEDFYNFACGRWYIFNSEKGQNNMMATTLASYIRMHVHMRNALGDESLPSVVRKIAEAYLNCGKYAEVTEEDGEWLDEVLGEVGGWPMVDKDWGELDYHWERNLALAIHNFIIKRPVTISVAENSFDTSKRIIQISQPLIEEPLVFDKQRILYVAKKISDKTDSEMEREFQEVEEFAGRLSKMSLSYDELLEDSKHSKVMSLSELKQAIRWINWEEFLQTVFKSYLPFQLKDSEQILVIGINYLSKLFESLLRGNTSKRVFANYIAVTLVQSLLDVNARIGMNQPTLLSADSVESSVKGVILPDDFSSSCFAFYGAKASPAVDYLNYRNRKAGMVDTKMLSYFVRAMEDLINEASWIDETTRKSALGKLHATNYFIGFPDRFKDPKQVEKYFAGLPELSSNVLKNQVEISRIGFKRAADLLRTPVDRKKWPFMERTQGTQVNAMHVGDLNVVVLPADIQTKPLFDVERPKFWNFGVFGWIIAHEITHGFDTSGRRRDKYGAYRNWWMPKAKEQFAERAQCLIEQYNKIPYGYKNYYVNGTQTVGENVADNGGMRQAYKAYKKWEKEHGKEKGLPGLEKYNIDQLFFISVAQAYCSVKMDGEALYNQHAHDVHSPIKMRFNPAATNFDKFAKAFKCKAGTPMNPVKKCVVW